MSDNTNVQVWMAGAIAAFTIDLFVYPLDTIKTRLQSQDYLKTYASRRGSRSSAFAIRGLYQGIGSAVVATLPAAGVFFSVYESSKMILGEALPSSVPLPITHSISSGVAELSSCLILTPAEVIKQNAQMLQKEPRGQVRRSTSMRALALLKDAPGGASRRLWSGYTALAGRNLPFTALQFPLFEAIRARIWAVIDRDSTKKRVGGVESGQHITQTMMVNGLSAAVSGSISSFLTTPADVVKTRMMLLDDRGEQFVASKGHGAAFRVTMQVYQEKGVPGLFRGWFLRSGWTALASGLYLGSYEGAKVWLRKDGVSEDAA